MEDTDTSTPADRLITRFEDGGRDAAAEYVEQVRSGTVDERKALLRSLRDVAEDEGVALGPLLPELASLLDDGERAVRLSAAKLCVAVTERNPAAGVPVVATLSDRLGDADEFYYVRARAAEALGYVAVERPDEVASPAVVAEFRIGLEFDEPAVREKLAKALEHVALGDPSRLRHQVADLATHLDDEAVLVRYHLCTTLAVVGCERPGSLVDVRDPLVARLDDESPYVRGRAAEALGLSATAEASTREPPFAPADGESDPFVTDRIRFARRCFEEGAREEESDVGTLAGIRATTADAVDAITAPAVDGECPHCGLERREAGPPFCPRCGVPQ